MGGGPSSYSTQFLSHPGPQQGGPRGPPGMSPSGMVQSRPGQHPSMGGMGYPSHPSQGQGQRMSQQHPGYPAGQQQGLKRPYQSEVHLEYTQCKHMQDTNTRKHELTNAASSPPFLPQGFPGQQPYGSGGMSPYHGGQPLQYPPGPQQRPPQSPSYHPNQRMPPMGQYQQGPPNPAQYYKVSSEIPLRCLGQLVKGASSNAPDPRPHIPYPLTPYFTSLSSLKFLFTNKSF